MKDRVGIQGYINSLLKSRHLTLAQFAGLLGYKSTTSLKRLMNDDVQSNGCRKFEAKMLSAFDLTDIEKNELKAAVEETIRGKDKRRNTNEILRFLSIAGAGVKSIDDHITLRIGENAQSLVDRYQQKQNVCFLILNCADLMLFNELSLLTKKQALQIRHYLFFDGNPANVVRLINALMGIFPYSGYDAWYLPSISSKAEPFISGNMIFVSYLDESGIEMQEMLLMNNQHEAFLSKTEQGYTGAMHYMNTLPFIQLKHTFFSNISMENYVQYSAAYAELEKDRSIWKIKPDIGIDYVPYDILYSALSDESAEIQADFSQIAEELITIYRQRVQNTYDKHKVIHTILKKSAMLEFAKTGYQTDHFWCMRPYTKAERKRILELLLEQQKNNVYFNLHFLKDDTFVRDTEIACYEGKGFLILESDTSYQLTESHSEIMLSCEPLEKEFIDFFRRELINKHCLSYQESIAFLNRLIRICS